MIEGAGHYARAQFPAETAALIVSFLKADARAQGLADEAIRRRSRRVR